MPYRATHDRGFTLAEVAVSMVILSIIAAAIGSVMMLVARCIPDTRSPSGAVVAGNGAVDQLATELYYAQSVTAMSPTSVTFTVAPRGSDVTPETIAYSWAGAGSPLLRQYNTNAAVPVATKVQDFALTYSKRTASGTAIQTTTSNGAVQQLAGFNGWTGLLSLLISLLDFSASNNNWISEYIPAISGWPSGATALVITKVQVNLKTSLLGGSFTVGIYKPQGGGSPVPTLTPIGTPAAMQTGLLSGLFSGWVDVNFNDVVITNPNQDFCIVVKGNADVQYMYSTSGYAQTFVMQYSNDGGSTWQPTVNQAYYQMPFQIYGY